MRFSSTESDTVRANFNIQPGSGRHQSLMLKMLMNLLVPFSGRYGDLHSPRGFELDFLSRSPKLAIRKRGPKMARGWGLLGETETGLNFGMVALTSVPGEGATLKFIPPTKRLVDRRPMSVSGFDVWKKGLLAVNGVGGDS